jgi:hypothetical protein
VTAVLAPGPVSEIKGVSTSSMAGGATKTEALRLLRRKLSDEDSSLKLSPWHC